MSKDRSMTAGIFETENSLSFLVKKTSMRYLDEFISLRCSPDLMALRLFPNSKEITESMAAFNAVRKTVGAKIFSDIDVNCYVIGDGCTPRTGALFAFLTKWRVFSIDPLLRENKEFGSIKRLSLHKYKVENFIKDQAIHCKEVKMHVIVAVHSHAPLEPVFKSVFGMGNRVVCIAIPCCFPQETGFVPNREYFDYGIHSPKRKIKIWDM